MSAIADESSTSTPAQNISRSVLENEISHHPASINNSPVVQLDRSKIEKENVSSVQGMLHLTTYLFV